MIDTLQRDGIAVLPPMAGAHEMAAHLATCPVYHGHVKGASVARRQPGNSTCWAAEDVLQAPGFLEYVLGFTDVARAYLGVDTPFLYSVNAFTTFPMTGPMNPDIQDWHRDKDDRIFLALFVYLTDVLQDEDGVHLYKLGTQTGATDGAVTTIRGPQGTAFIEDGRGLHMGIRPAQEPRTMAWARWGVSDPPPSYLWDHIQPVARKVLGDRYRSEWEQLLHLVVR